MRMIRTIYEKLRELSDFSKLAVKAGALMMLSFYITGAVAYIIAPHVPNYMGVTAVYHGCLEAAPASLVSGICAAVICDLVCKSKNR